MGNSAGRELFCSLKCLWEGFLSFCKQYIVVRQHEAASASVVFPVRVIDLAATFASDGGVCFAVVREWEFHVISHTWSKGVRDLSDEIGREAAGQHYDEAFARANFKANECYGQLLDFLMILAKDGVRKVWFDAICINQQDDVEKKREILNMGSFYGKSQGCYVLTHGLGQSYRVWPVQEQISSNFFNEVVPRWFTRVWTLQEFVLPQKLTFVVGGLTTWMTLHLNSRITRCHRSHMGFCRCCTFSNKDIFKSPEFRYGGVYIMHECGGEQIAAATSTSIQEEVQLVETIGQACDSCGCKEPLIRKAGHLSYEGTIYFVDREAYLFLISLARAEAFEHVGYTAKRLFMGAGYSRMCEMYGFRDQRYNTAREVIKHVSWRECTNQEDRFLGILGLLPGVDGIKQLRTGGSLEDLIVDIASKCDPNLVIEICTVNGEGNKTVGMSWAPHMISDTTGFIWSEPDTQIERRVEVVGVQRDGILLKGKTLSGRVAYVPSSGMSCMSLPCMDTPLIYIGWSERDLKRNIFIGASMNTDDSSMDNYFRGTITIPLHHGGHPIVMGNHSGVGLSFNMCVILLGVFTKNDWPSRGMHQNFHVAMACISNLEMTVLHKIGLLTAYCDASIENIFDNKSQIKQHLIGGFGEYLDDYVLVHFKEPNSLSSNK